MQQVPASQTRLRVADLPERRATEFELRPDDDALAALAGRLGIDAVRKLRLKGVLRPEGARGWQLEAQLGATVVQPCIVTLAPVTTRLEETVIRRYSPDFDRAEAEAHAQADADGTPIPEDETLEPLPAVIDLEEVMEEALALALPLYPRADGATLGQGTFAAPGTRPLSDEDVKPFAGLRALRDKLDDGSDDGTGGDG